MLRLTEIYNAFEILDFLGGDRGYQNLITTYLEKREGESGRVAKKAKLILPNIRTNSS